MHQRSRAVGQKRLSCISSPFTKDLHLSKSAQERESKMDTVQVFTYCYLHNFQGTPDVNHCHKHEQFKLAPLEKNNTQFMLLVDKILCV